MSIIFINILCSGVVADTGDENRKRIEDLFQQYHDEQATEEMIYHELDEMEHPVPEVIRPLLRSYRKQLTDFLREKSLKENVLPACRKKYHSLRQKVREKLLSDEYNDTWEQRTYRRKVRKQSGQLIFFYNTPLEWYMRNHTDLYTLYIRVKMLRSYLSEVLEEEPSGVGGEGKRKVEDRVEDLLRTARGIVRTESVGASRELQPYWSENRDVRERNRRLLSTLSEDEQKIILLVNQYREALGQRRLKIHPALVRAAEGHNREMREKDYFSHSSPIPDRSTVGKRVKQEGFHPGVAGENIAYGKYPPEAIVKQWRRSPEHHQNMARSNYHYMGVDRRGPFWTLVLSGLGSDR